MIRLCPSCNTERPVTEFFCEGTVEGHNCGWDLSSVDVTTQGTSPAPVPGTPAPANPACRNGHPNSPGDLICSICGEILEEISPPAPQPEPETETGSEPAPVETFIDGWRLQDRIVSSSAVRERFTAVRESDQRRGVLTLYAAASEPDGAIYDLLRRLPRDHVPEIIATGRWCERAYEVVEEFPGGTLSNLPLDVSDQTAIGRLVRELGQASTSSGRPDCVIGTCAPPTSSFAPPPLSISS
jgi:primosomal replication protein N''